MKHDPAQAAPAHGPIDGVLRYHRRTKHHFDRFAPGPAQLDWANQPDPFRRYEGCALIFALLARTLPRAERKLGRRPVPWDVLPWAPAIDLALFVHRVDGLAPGLYLLARDPARVASLRRATYTAYVWSVPPGRAEDLPLFLLQEADVRELAAQLSCGQRIAADGAFSLAMISEFEPSLRRHGAWFYRRLFWETGLLGQLLYLEAQALGLRATGIGCFFDDPVHQVMGFGDLTFQSLYHFAIGAAVDDPRLTTLPPYGGLAQERLTRT